MSEDTVKPFTESQLSPEMAALFAARYRIECEIDDIKQAKIAPLNEDLKTLKGDFKAKSGLDMKITNAMYTLFKLDRGAERLVEQEDARKRKKDLERAWNALAQGKTLDWLTVEAFKVKKVRVKPDPMLEPAGRGPDDDEGETGRNQGDETVQESAPGGLTFASAERDETDPAIEETTKAWEGAAPDDTNDDEYDEAGFTFAAGKKAGAEGESVTTNPHPEGSSSHDTWLRGYRIGAKEFVNREHDAGNVVRLHDGADEESGGGGGEAEHGDDDDSDSMIEPISLPSDDAANHAAQ